METQASMFPDLIPHGDDDYEARWRSLGLSDRWRILKDYADEVGGIVPRSVVHQELSISRQRVAQLIDALQLEELDFFGVRWVTVRSLEAWKQADSNKGGRGHVAQPIWKEAAQNFRMLLATGKTLLR
jgi:hypothetical protein